MYLTDFILQFNPVTQALFATWFTWALTAADTALVFFTRSVNPQLMDCMLDFAAGMMVRNVALGSRVPGVGRTTGVQC